MKGNSILAEDRSSTCGQWWTDTKKNPQLFHAELIPPCAPKITSPCTKPVPVTYMLPPVKLGTRILTLGQYGVMTENGARGTYSGPEPGSKNYQSFNIKESGALFFKSAIPMHGLC